MLGIYVLVGIGVVAIGIASAINYLDSILDEDIR